MMKAAYALLIAILMTNGCSPNADALRGGAANVSGDTAAAAPGPQPVDVVRVQSAFTSTKIHLPGQLLPYESVNLYPKVNGFIQDIFVDRGSRVREGQLLVRLTAPETITQIGQAAAAVRGAQDQLNSAQAKLAADRVTYERLASAAKTPGVVAENDVNVARQTASSDAALVQAAQANVGASREAFTNARQLGAYLEIRAPFDGVITARNLQPGALVGPAAGQSGSQPILQIVTAKHLRLVVPVPENSVQGARPGGIMTFTVSTAPGRTFQAPIARMAQAVDSQTRTMMVEADVASPNAALVPGTFATIEWSVRRSYPTLRVPATAVANDQQQQFVIRVAHGTASWVDVTTGMTDGGTVEVFGDLTSGDMVVRRGTDAILPDTKVRPMVARARGSESATGAAPGPGSFPVKSIQANRQS
jgi:membrane fusion protein (multidrug efflux system)